MADNQYSQKTNAYQEPFSELYLEDTPFEELDISIDDDKLNKMLITSLQDSRDYWNQKPWNLQETDKVNTAFLLGDQLNDNEYLKNDSKYVDNRLFSSTRAILSYATGQLAKPDITPSKGDKVFVKGARDISMALYQHASDDKVEFKVRAAVMNLISRKRGFLKLRWDPEKGEYGDIVTEVCNPEDIIIDKNARYLENPDKIFHRISCSIDELVSRFPEKKDEIFAAYSIQRGVFTQTSRFVTYFECWFSYTDGTQKEGVAWFIPEKKLILDKMPNPNWVYFKSQKKEKQANITSCPPKPFISFNYINTGRSYIDETCLVEQALPMQKMLNKRGRQIAENADYVNGRYVASKKAFSQEDARNLVNKGPKTIALVDSEDVSKSFINVGATALPSYVENTLYDDRNEIDGLMGTPSQFKGSQPEKSDTLGRDLMIKQQAGALQDDLVRSISLGMEEYYKLLLQMMRVYYTDDYWFQCKGGDGKYEFILINGNLIDSNVKVSVEIDSTLPLDKPMIRDTAMKLWSAGNAIDIKTLYEDLGLPNPDIRAERYLKSQLDPVKYLQSIEIGQIDTEAEADILLLTANKVPEERDEYSADYFNYFNQFLTTNRFNKLDQAAQERITAFLMATQHTASESTGLKEIINDAGMIALQPPQPMGQDPNQPIDPNASNPDLPPDLAQQNSALPPAPSTSQVPPQVVQ